MVYIIMLSYIFQIYSLTLSHSKEYYSLVVVFIEWVFVKVTHNFGHCNFPSFIKMQPFSYMPSLAWRYYIDRTIFWTWRPIQYSSNSHTYWYGLIGMQHDVKAKTIDRYSYPRRTGVSGLRKTYHTGCIQTLYSAVGKLVYCFEGESS